MEYYIEEYDQKRQQIPYEMKRSGGRSEPWSLVYTRKELDASSWRQPNVEELTSRSGWTVSEEEDEKEEEAYT